MRHKAIKFTAVILALLLIMTGTVSCGGKGTPGGIDGIYSYMQSVGRIDRDEPLTDAYFYKPGDPLTDWAMIFALRSGKETSSERYLSDLERYVTAAYATENRLSDYKVTEWHRAILAVLAAGGDPTSFGTDPEGKPIDLVRDGVYCWNGSGGLDEQGSNALIYALLVINAGGFSEPADAVYTEDGIIASLLQYQGDDGSFGLAAPGGDSDMTAMALQALAPYQGTGRSDVDAAVEKGLGFLADQQIKGGYFPFAGKYSCETCAQVILALAALGIDPETDERFIKSGKSAEDALMTFRNGDGGFGTGFERDGSLMTSEVETSRQAGCALLALKSLRENGNGRFFDFSR